MLKLKTLKHKIQRTELHMKIYHNMRLYKRLAKKLTALTLLAALLLLPTACVDQHEGGSGSGKSGEPRVIATSYATLQICDRLGLKLIGRCQTSGELPEAYQALPALGTAMSPDAEAIALLEPSDVIGPDTLRESIEPTYKAAGVPYTFIDLQSVPGMYESIELIGNKYGLNEAADKLIAEYRDTMAEFQKSIEGKDKPSVLVLMGLPGAYIECTPNSYVGSLVELAGAESAVQVQDDMNFVSWNTEELLQLDPDYILLTVHGIPDKAMEMFAKEFSTNDIWKHFRAVQEGRIYQLDYKIFGMSATFSWREALDVLRGILYEGSAEAYEINSGGTAQ